MKKLILGLLISAIFVAKSNSQSFTENYLGEDFMQYKNASFKLNDEAISGFTHTFYSKLSDCQAMFNDNVIYPDSRYSFKTVKDSLVNRVFKVENIVGKDGNTFDSKSSTDKPIFILKDTETEQNIYFKYDPEYEHNFPFFTSKIELDLESLCEKIERNVDEFTDVVTLNSPMMDSYSISPMIIYKTIKKSTTIYSLSLRTYGSTVNVGESGAIILFTDGTKMTKNVKIDVDSDSRGFEYSAFITLSQSDLKTLSDKTIKKFRLYIYDESVPQGDAERLSAFTKCIIGKK